MKKQTTLVAVLVVGITLPALAQDGFRIGLSAGSMKTTGNAQYFGTIAAPGPNPTVTTLNLDQPTQTPLSLDLAWVKGDDEFSLTYLSSSEKSSSSYVNPTTGIALTLFPFGINGPGLTATGKQSVTLVDLAWKRTLVKGDAGSFAFSTGIRYSNVSDEVSYQQLDASSNPAGVSIHAKGEGTGFGLVSGIHGRMNITDRMWLTTGFSAALINNTNKTDDYTLASTGPQAHFQNGDTHQSLLQTDAYLRYNMNFVNTFNGYLGYEVRDFNKDAVKVNNVYTNLGLPTVAGGFGLSGFTLGVSYTF